MAQAPLTRRQRQILDFLRAYQAENGMSPTLEEMAEQFGVNKVTIFGHVAELERKGLLRRPHRGVSRGLLLVEEDDAPVSSPSLPILGRIAAGAPIETIEDPETLDLADLVPRGREVYALRVQGSSMIEDAIADGDLVLVERRNQARNGETVVAVLGDGDATLKRFYREAGGVRLQPANSTMKPIWIPDPETEPGAASADGGSGGERLEIRGVVIGVVRRY